VLLVAVVEGVGRRHHSHLEAGLSQQGAEPADRSGGLLLDDQNDGPQR